MTDHAPGTNRRRFIKLTVAGLAAVSFANALLVDSAAVVAKVSESDPVALAVGYKEDATKAPNRKDPKAVCSNCNLYSGQSGASDGACSIFSGRPSCTALTETV
jgi:High potential iron-sulfur protein